MLVVARSRSVPFARRRRRCVFSVVEVFEVVHPAAAVYMYVLRSSYLHVARRP